MLKKFTLCFLAVSLCVVTTALAQTNRNNRNTANSQKIALVGTTWKIYETINGETEWGTYTFLAGGKIAEDEEARWKLVGNKLNIKEQYGDINLVIRGDKMTGNGQLGMNPRPFPMKGIKIKNKNSFMAEGGIILVPIPQNSNDSSSLSKDELKSDDLSALFSFFQDNISPKGEYEKTVDYNNKIAKIVNQTVYGSLKGTSTWKFIRPISNRDFYIFTNYNPDTETMNVEFMGASYRFHPGRVFSTDFSLPKSRKIGFIFANFENFFNNTPRVRFDRDRAIINFNVSPEEAPSAKSNLTVIFIFSPENPYYNGKYGTGLADNVPAIYGYVKEIRLINSETGRVYYVSKGQKLR